MKPIVSVLILLVGLTLVSCSPSYRIVRNEHDNAARWDTYRTFAYLDTTRLNPSPGTAYQAAMEQVKQAVTAELTNRGYKLVDGSSSAAKPDLLVNIGAIVNEKTQTRPTTIYEAPRYIGQRRYHWQSQEVPVGTYQEGTLNLHIVDSERENLIWDVAIASILGKKGVTQAQINEAVTKVFSKFPGKQV